MQQSKLGSFIEACVNTVIGFSINFVMNLILLPIFFDKSISLQANFVMGLVFTVISVLRSYFIRRWFNGPLHTLIAKAFPK